MTGTENPYITAHGAAFAYRGGFALDPVTTALHAGEIAFLLGPNGSGKTTLGKLFCGILKPAAGEVRILGRSTKELTLGAIGSLVGYAFQEPRLQLFADTVLEDMVFADGLRGANPEETEARALYWLQFFGLSALRDQSVHRLSGGERQRLALAGILMQGAEFLILDEPTAGLDDRRRAELAELLGGLRETEGKGMLIISHDVEFAQCLAGRILVVKEGAIVYDRRNTPV